MINHLVSSNNVRKTRRGNQE